MNKLKNNSCIIDLETTGTDVNNDRIIEISVIKIFAQEWIAEKVGFPNREEKTMLLNPTISIPKAASDIHGFTDADVKDKPTFKQIAKALHAFIFGCDIIGYNSISFDVPLLYNEFARSGIQWEVNKVLLIDVCNIYKQKEQRTLADAMRFYCNKDHAGAHGALADAQATEQILLAQFDKYDDIRHMNINELAVYSNYGKKLIDVAGKFTYNEAGEIIFAFGPHKGKAAKSEKGFLEWMLNPKQTFNQDTKEVVRKILLQ